MRVKNHPWVRRMALDNWRRGGWGTEHKLQRTEGEVQSTGYSVHRGGVQKKMGTGVQRERQK